jgi:predicted NBD/HSP70 family sugar kinase
MLPGHGEVKSVLNPKNPPPSLRMESLGAVLSFAWDAQAFTATDAMSVGFTRSTTIDLLDELIERGLVRELDNARAVGDYQKGRPARRFRFDADYGVVVGVDAGRGHLTTTVATLVGEVSTRRHLTLDPARDSAETRRTIIRGAVEQALADVDRDLSQVVALCIGVPAPVDARGLSPAHPDGFWSRMNPGLREMFPEVASVEVMNDASLAAVAEGAVGAGRGCDDYITLLAGERLGAGVVVDGRVLRGAHGGVAEMVAFDHVPGVAGAWGLGYRAAEWARASRSRGEILPGSPLARMPLDEITGQIVLELARDGDADAVRIVSQVGELLATLAGVLGSLFDPSLIIVSGAISDGAQLILDAAARALPDRLDLPAPALLASELGADVVSTGAVFQAVRTARTSVLHLPLPARQPV